MRRRRREPVVPEPLVTAIAAALDRVDTARSRLDELRRTAPALDDLRRAHADLRRAFTDADRLLREATALARADSYREWSRWRHRLSVLDTARQQHLFEESDDSGVLLTGSVRAVDTGMSGPAIGEFQHGECSPPGKPATYGLDLEATLHALDRTPASGTRDFPDRPGCRPEVPWAA